MTRVSSTPTTATLSWVRPTTCPVRYASGSTRETPHVRETAPHEPPTTDRTKVRRESAMKRMCGKSKWLTQRGRRSLQPWGKGDAGAGMRGELPGQAAPQDPHEFGLCCVQIAKMVTRSLEAGIEDKLLLRPFFQLQKGFAVQEERDDDNHPQDTPALSS